MFLGLAAAMGCELRFIWLFFIGDFVLKFVLLGDFIPLSQIIL